MSLPTCAVACNVNDDTGAPVAGAKITARLDRFEVYNGYVVPELVEVETNSSGVATLNLWPNQLGSTESSYTIRIVAPNGKTLKTTATVPNVSNASLHLIANLPAYEGKSDGQLIIDAAVAAVAPAVAAKDLAVTKAAEAAASATAASNSATNASTSASTATAQATNASSSATAAANSATAASGSATSASGSATTATTKAGEAATSATNAANSATAASTSATTATTQAGTATTKASEAAASAATATTQAGIATAKAGEATASATNAANSATAASASAATAQGHATAAGTSASNASNSAGAASISATNAAASNSAAGTSATAASGSASQAAISASAANTSAGNAATSATAAANSATASANSATASANSATLAQTQVGLAAAQVTLATAQASNAAASASAANSSAGAASGSAALALSVYGTAAAQQSALTAAQSAASVAQAAAASAGAVLQQDLSAVNVAALHRSPNAVTAMFVYDTSKDSDGGAWTEKCQGTSWYNEALSGTWLGAQDSEFQARHAGATVSATELVTNGTFSNGTTGWNAARASLSVTDGVMKVTATAGFANISTSFSTVAGKSYRVSIDLLAATPGKELRAYIGTNSFTGDIASSILSGSTTRTFAFTATGTTTWIFLQDSSGNYIAGDSYSIDNVSVREVTALNTKSNDYFQFSPDGKFYRLWKNRLPHSETFASPWTNAAVNINLNAGTAPNGTVTAAQLVATSANAVHYIMYTDPDSSSGATYTRSIYVKAGTSNFVKLSRSTHETGAGSWAVVNLTDGSFLSGGGQLTGGIENAGNGWWRVPITVEATATSRNRLTVAVANSFDTNIPSFAGNGESILIWGAQYELGSVATAYERKVAEGSASEVFRGNKADFPRLAGIVAEAGNVNIYDLTEAGRPMWMRFVGNPLHNAGPFLQSNSGSPVTDVKMLNGLFAYTVGGSNPWVGYSSADFIRERFKSNYSLAYSSELLANRNAAITINNNSLAIERGHRVQLAGAQCYAVAMTVLPDAPLDPVTGLAVPTIAVGTAGGPSVIHHDGVVTNPYGGNTASLNINFGSRGEVIFHIGENGLHYRVSLPPYTTFAAYTGPAMIGNLVGSIGNWAGNRVNAKRQAGIRTAAANSVVFMRDNANGPRSSAALVTNTFNTGHMHGDIRRAYLADIEAGSVGAELITNGDFSNGATGWTISAPGANTITVSGGSVRFVANGSADAAFFYHSWPGATAVGKPYRITFDVLPGSTGQLKVTTLGVNSTVGEYGFDATPGTKSFTLISSSAGSVGIARVVGQVADATIDNISVREVIADRSYKAARAPLAGTLTKSPVASAAQLVAFSGFDNLDYVREPYSTDLDFGTGDWSVGAWLNTTGFGPHNLLANPERFEDSSWPKTNAFVQTNLLTWSQDFDNAAWTKTELNTTGTPPWVNVAVAPDGTTTAEKLIATNINTAHDLYSSGVAIAGNTAYSYSIYAKAGELSNVSLAVNSASNWVASPNASFDLTTGAKTSGSAAATITPVGNGWYRLTLTGTTVAAPAGERMWVRLGSFAGNGTDGLFIWGAQLVQGSVPGDYQRTTGATAAVQYAAPNGTLTAEKLVHTVTEGGFIEGTNTVSASTPYAFSLYAKAGELTQVRLQSRDIPNAILGTFDLLNGTATLGAGASSVSILPVGNGWFRCIAIYTPTGSSSNRHRIFPIGTADGSSGVYIYGAQLNRGSVATVYKPGQIPVYDNAGWLVDRSAEYLGSELVTNGDFSGGGTGWTTSAGGITVTSGQMAFATATNVHVSQSGAYISGRVYRVALDVVSYTSGTPFVAIGQGSTVNIPAPSTPGTKVLFVQAGATDNVLRIYGGGFGAGGTIVIDNISVREYWNPHIRLGLDSQGRLITSVSDGITTRTVTSTGTYNSGTWVKAEAAYRAGRLALLANGQEIGFTHGTPLLSLTSRYNLLSWSEQFDNAAWVRATANAVQNSTTAPDGTATADTVRLNAGASLTTAAVGLFSNGSNYVSQQTASALSVASYTYSAYVKGGVGLSHVQLRVGTTVDLNPTVAESIVRLSDGAVISGTPTVTNAGDGWWRVSITFTATAAVHRCGIWFWNSSSISSAAGTESIFIWGAQLELGSVATPYQRTTTLAETNVADLTIGSGTDVYAAFPGSISQVKLSGTVPSADQSAWIYEQEKQLFRAGAQCCLPDSASIVDLAYDEVTDRWVAISTTNESNWNGLVRTSVTAVPAGSYSRVSYGGGVELLARSTTNPGVDVSIPPYGLREELVKRAEAAARLTRTLSTFDYVGGFTANTTSGSSGLASVANLTYPLTTTIVGAVVTGSGIPAGTSVAGISGTNIHLSAAATATATGVQVNFTDFVLPAGYEAEIVMVAGAVRREGATQDYTRLFDGFRETIRFAVAPGNTAWVQIQAVRINA